MSPVFQDVSRQFVFENFLLLEKMLPAKIAPAAAFMLSTQYRGINFSVCFVLACALIITF